MPTIGYDSTTGLGGSTRTTADSHFAMTLYATHTPSESENVTEVGFHCEGIAGSFEVGVYRISTLAKVCSATVTATGSGRFTTSVSGALTSGVAYCIAWRCVSNCSIYLNSDVGNTGIRNTSLTGANALADPFVDNGAALGSRWSMFATTEAGGTSIVPHRMALLGVG